MDWSLTPRLRKVCCALREAGQTSKTLFVLLVFATLRT